MHYDAASPNIDKLVGRPAASSWENDASLEDIAETLLVADW